MKVVVTGVAGFIGSALAESLVRDGYDVVGVDCFTSYYARMTKLANVAWLLRQPSFRLDELDLRDAALEQVVVDADVVFHQAAQPGVRLSWADAFPEYVSHNVLATQRLLEAVRAQGSARLVYASSSSVYGNAPRYPTVETDLLRPHSPYGVTKLAGEHLCSAYARNWGMSIVSLRYFTVYGPRQRPDMALHRLFEAALRGEPFPLYGDGSNVRDFTFVEDVVAANRAAAETDIVAGLEEMNVAGGSSISMMELIERVGALSGASVLIDRRPSQPGDVARTGGDVTRAHALLGWSPKVDLDTGLERQLAWHRGAPQW